ncbi:MAG: hypothetical protein JSW24_04835 [Dehalococcoidia bacterium]|nr:MAG: hypothetical protein JSW24_04835 [Dehalococcoidia bacterium]
MSRGRHSNRNFVGRIASPERFWAEIGGRRNTGGVLDGRSPCYKIFPPPSKGESERSEASLKQLIPLPLIKGKGIKGIGLL